MKTIKLFNGGGQRRRNGEETGHIYLGAFSKPEAVALMHLAGFEDFTLHELNTYYSPDCWGDQMDGIRPGRGVWAVAKGQDYLLNAVVRKLV